MTKYESRGQGSRHNRRRMPNGDSTTNVGDLVGMESQGYPILRVTGEIDKLRIGNVRTYGGRGRHSRNSKFSKVIESDKAT
ncbi:hypothetical protein Acr_22g0006860 [Actinidia rufa]|uniref:Uncharacterized protein n=1 Tax=Actinidia rufa TaxID=165716 RepID=A0A7J0GKL7_9ERIC|nr:hypothetical protein Acr_22g0006860 [Actinidia rufa]